MDTNIIFNEDCMNTLQRLESNSIDLIVTSPPYNKNAYATDKGTSGFWSAMRGRQIAYDTYSDNMPQEAYEAWQRNILSECIRVLKPTGYIL